MFIKSFTSIVSLLFSVSVSANIAIIVNKDFSETVDKNYVKRIYLGKEQLFPSGSKIMILCTNYFPENIQISCGSSNSSFQLVIIICTNRIISICKLIRKI